MKPRRYETLMLLSPDLSEEEHEQTKQKFIDIIEKMSGRIVKVEDWGRRRLAYPVKKQFFGSYVLLDYMGTPELLTEYERNMRIDERIWKNLSLVLDKNFTEDKYQAEIDRIQADNARREAERAQREAERAQREAQAQAQASEETAGETPSEEPEAAVEDVGEGDFAEDEDFTEDDDSEDDDSGEDEDFEESED